MQTHRLKSSSSERRDDSQPRSQHQRQPQRESPINVATRRRVNDEYECTLCGKHVSPVPTRCYWDEAKPLQRPQSSPARVLHILLWVYSWSVFCFLRWCSREPLEILTSLSDSILYMHTMNFWALSWGIVRATSVFCRSFDSRVSLIAEATRVASISALLDLECCEAPNSCHESISQCIYDEFSSPIKAGRGMNVTYFFLALKKFESI